jgi:DNA replication protein DnaC
MPAMPRSEPFAEQACPKGVCDGSGWILGPEDLARPCECREQRLKRGRNKGVASVIPPRYRGVSFDRPPVSDMARKTETEGTIEKVREFVTELDSRLAQGRGLWLSGDTGTGKTTLAMLVSKEALSKGHSVAIYSLPKLLARIRRTYDGDADGDSYSTFFERLTMVDLLHIDDFGAEKRSDWVLEQLYALVNDRYEDERSIMLTTNLTVDKLEDQIGRRTVSRLTETCEQVALFGIDRRLENAPH